MSSRCKNPSCRKQLRYLHEGKLFWKKPVVDTHGNAVSDGEWFWLCDLCVAQTGFPGEEDISHITRHRYH